jgi:Nucleotidyltransferase domain
MNQIEARREYSQGQIASLREKLKDAATILNGKACVYATGSYGRLEAGKESDLDLFIVGRVDEGKKARLSRLDEVCVKADLIKVTRASGLPEFDGDGEYLQHYTSETLAKTLGRPEDDALNTFTARLLLLLESHPLLEDKVYDESLSDVIAEYWRDYEDRKDSFIPSFLVNDILRLWRTFCVNYEARTKTSPPEKKALRRVKNYKLKHSRMLTCYSIILELLAVHRISNTVHPSDFLLAVKRTPTQRLSHLMQIETLHESHGHLMRLLNSYNEFLEVSSVGTPALADQFMDNSTHSEFIGRANEFGKQMHDTLISVGAGSTLARFLMV